MGAYLGIVTKPGTEERVVNTLVDRLLLTYTPNRTYGPYDIIMKVEGENPKDFREKIKLIKAPPLDWPEITRLDTFVILSEFANKYAEEESKKAVYLESDRFLIRTPALRHTVVVSDFEVRQRRGPDAFLFIKTLPTLEKKVQETLYKMAPYEIPYSSIVTGPFDIVAELYVDNPLVEIKQKCDNFNTIIGLKEQMPIVVAREEWRADPKRVAENIARNKMKEEEPLPQECVKLTYHKRPDI